MSDVTPKLNACGCCEAEPLPAALANRPGLAALSYRVGTYGLFLQRMLDQIHAAEASDGTRPLAGLTTRAADDPAVALLDAWAVVADVLTFYQERIANEGFLRTAVERRSVLELARAIGYELNPGVAASAYLQFTVEEIIGAAGPAANPPRGVQSPAGPGSSPFNSGIVAVPKGTQVQSVPAPGQLPQTFETSSDFEARVEWNAMPPRQTRPQDIALYGGKLYLLGTAAGFAPNEAVYLPAAQVALVNPRTRLDPSLTAVAAVPLDQVYLQGINTGLKAGDRLLLVGTSNGITQTLALVVRNVEANPAAGTTAVDFVDDPVSPSFAPGSFDSADLKLQGIAFTQANVNQFILGRKISEGDLQAFLKMNGWSAADLAMLVNTPPTVPPSGEGAFAFKATAAFFGNNAPKWESLPDPAKALRADPYPNNWDQANDGAGAFIWTDSQGASYADADVFLERSFPQILPQSWTLFESSAGPAVAYQINGVVEKALADYGLSGKCTGLQLNLSSAGAHFDDLGGVCRNDPAVASWGHDRLDVFVIGTDGALYHKWWDGAQWGPSATGFEFMGGSIAGNPAAVSWDHDRLDVFVVGTDGGLYHKAWNGSEWLPSLTTYDNLGIPSPGGRIRGNPAVVSWDHDRLDVFVVGSADGALYHKWWDGAQWGPSATGFEFMGGIIVGNPAVASWDHDRLDVFVVGTDGALYHKAWNGWQWLPSLTGYDSLGMPMKLTLMFVGQTWIYVPVPDPIRGDPAVVSWGHDRLDVFVVGSTDGALYHKWWDGAQWGPSATGFEFMGGSIAGNPAAASWDHDRLDVFVVGTDGALYHKAWNGSEWLPGLTGYDKLGGFVVSNTAVASWDHDRLDVFVIGGDRALYHAAWNGQNWGNVPFPVRKTTAFVQSQQLPLADLPVVDDIPAGTTELMLDWMVLGLKPGQPVALAGERNDAPGVTAREILPLADILHKGGITSLQFATGSQFGYLRSSLTVSANVTLATHGAAVQEVLGSGDGAQANQRFTLKRPPLTYVSAPTPTGGASTLQIRVNGLLWQEAPTSFGLTAGDKNYVVRLGDDGTPTVTFGDPAARLKTGQQNVTALYRTGIGLAGNVAAGSLSMLQSRQPGLRGVTNPLAASGGADPQDLAHARANAPLTVLTLDRIVSLDDYESFARAFAGVGKAQAVEVWSGAKRLVHITVGAADGATIDSTWPLYQALVQAILQAHDPVQNFAVAGYQPLVFNLTAGILIDQPTYEPKTVLAASAAALADTFRFANRDFAQAVTAAEIVTLLQAVPGVIAVDLTQLYLTGDTNGPLQTEPAPFLTALPARYSQGAVLPAQLLLLNPLGVTLTEMTA
jgi:hypothetical protein